jgi:hypothetical protein
MGDNNRIQGEGNYDAGRRFQREEQKFVKDPAKVKRGADEAEKALDGPEGEDLERARRETGKDQM